MTRNFDKRVQSILREVLRGSNKRNHLSEQEARYQGQGTADHRDPRRLRSQTSISNRNDHKYTPPQYGKTILNPFQVKTKKDPNERAIKSTSHGHDRHKGQKPQKPGSLYNSKRPGGAIVIKTLPNGDTITGMNPHATNLNHSDRRHKRFGT